MRGGLWTGGWLWLSGCGAPVTPPVTEEPEEAAPTAQAPAPLAVPAFALQKTEQACDLVVYTHEGGDPIRLAELPDCAAQVDVETSGERLLVQSASSAPKLVSLCEGTTTALPPTPERSTPHPVSTTLRFDAEGALWATQSWGIGPRERFEGMVGYPEEGRAHLRLSKTGWDERANTVLPWRGPFGRNIPQETFDASAFKPGGQPLARGWAAESLRPEEVVSDAATVGPLQAASGQPSAEWAVEGAAPTLASPVQLQEVAYFRVGPPLVGDGQGGWAKLPGVTSRMQVQSRRGHLALLADVREGLWRVVDLTRLEVVLAPTSASASRGFWPTPLPCRPDEP